MYELLQQDSSACELLVHVLECSYCWYINCDRIHPINSPKSAKKKLAEVAYLYFLEHFLSLLGPLQNTKGKTTVMTEVKEMAGKNRTRRGRSCSSEEDSASNASKGTFHSLPRRVDCWRDVRAITTGLRCSSNRRLRLCQLSLHVRPCQAVVAPGKSSFAPNSENMVT